MGDKGWRDLAPPGADIPAEKGQPVVFSWAFIKWLIRYLGYTKDKEQTGFFHEHETIPCIQPSHIPDACTAPDVPATDLKRRYPGTA